jgi:hypothetical protein
MVPIRSTYTDIEEDDIIDFVLTYNILDCRESLISIYRSLGKDVVGNLLYCFERSFAHELDE